MMIATLFAAVFAMATLLPGVTAPGLPPPKDRASVQTEEFVPRWDGNDIVAGSKRLSVRADSGVTLTEGGKQLFTMAYGCRADSSATGKTYWPRPCYRFLEGGGKMYREGNALIHERPFRLEDFEWKDAFKQRIELLPDGLVAIEVVWNDPDNPNLKLRPIGATWTIPYETAKGFAYAVNDAEEKFPDGPAKKGHEWSCGANGIIEYSFFRGHAARQFKMFARASETGGKGFMFRLAAGMNFRVSEKVDGRRRGYKVYLDIRKGAAAVSGEDVRGGVDFRAVENMGLAQTGTRNLLQNPSFERGLAGLYRSGDVGYEYYPEKWDLPVWTADPAEHFHGARSLKILAWNKGGKDFRNLETTGGMILQPVVADPGKYTLSMYVKGDRPGDLRFSVWISNFSTGSSYANIPGGRLTVWPGTQWKRIVLPVELPVSMPVAIHLTANYRKGPAGAVWVDAVQFEKGSEATDFIPPPAEAELVTAAYDDFLPAKTDIAARLVLSAKPGAKGTARVRVRDFFGEERFDRTFPFAADASGRAEILPGFDSAALGLGVFAVQTDYALADGSSAREFDRFAICEYLDNSHPRRFLCADDYSCPARQENVRHILERWRKVGIGSKADSMLCDREAYALYASNGIPICATHAPTRYTDKNGVKRWCYRLHKSRGSHLTEEASQPDVLFADPVLDPDCPDGVPTEKYLAKVRAGGATLARTYPFVDRWQFGSEFFGTYSTEYWSPDGNPTNAYMNFAKILKAFGEGIKSVCPEKPYAGDDPWNMNPGQGIDEVAGILAAANSLGWKFDKVSFHSYRNRPEAPDLDADLAAVRKMMNDLGYGGAPLDLPEGMHWGPYEIPQWSTISASWGGAPITWPNGAISYDIGWTEKVSAAWFARSWVMALRHEVRLACASMHHANFSLEHDRLTPRAAQLVSNVIGHQLGHAKGFVADARFAPHVRAYVFDDGFDRPVAVVWGCDPEVDAGRKAPPVAEVDLDGILERVTDLMNNARPFAADKKFAFSVSSFPLFLRGRKGCAQAFAAAIKKATIVSGGTGARVMLGASVKDSRTLDVFARNLLDAATQGELNGRKIAMPALGEAHLQLPLGTALDAAAVRDIKLPLVFKAADVADVRREMSFTAAVAGESAYGGEDPVQVDWKAVPCLALKPWGETPRAYGGTAQVAWNAKGLFVRVAVRDARFVHEEFVAKSRRNGNDCLQIGIDGYGDARNDGSDGVGQDDYEYAIFPSADGSGAVAWANRVADRQITGNTKEHGNCLIPDIRAGFERKGDTCVYTAFIPKKRIYPGTVGPGAVVPMGITVFNADDPHAPDASRVKGGLSLAGENGVGRPQGWTAFVLEKRASVQAVAAAPGTSCTNDYILSVAGRNVDVMAVPKSTCYSEDKAFPYSYAMFDADEEVLVEIRSPMDLSRARVLPQRSVARDIRAAKDSFSFRAKPPFTLAVEPLRTRHRALIISANLPERKPPRAGDANVLYYGPGRHRLDGVLEVGSGQTLYLAPGAWLEGAIRANGDNVTICGRGVISGLPWEHRKGPAHDMVNLSGRNVTIRDVTLMGSWFYTLALENVSGGLVENVKVLGGRCNNDDGIDPIAARDVTIRDCFVRTHDDCIAPKDWIENLLVERCSLWADGANTIRLGFECAGGPSRPFRKIRFRDIEILHLSMNNDKPPDAYWVEAAIHLQPSNGMVFEDIVFENFNFDFCPQAMDMLLVVRTHPCQNGAPHPHKEGGHVRNVTFRNFNLPPRRPLGALGIWLQSIDPTHAIEDVTFENMVNFEVPVGIRGVARNIRGLPRGIVRDETGSWRDYEAWRPYKTRIACIGDSITYGFGLKNRERDAYPAQLQRMLDEKFPGKYEVRNFGNPGRGVYTHTKFKGTCRAFASVPEHASALAWHPDVVICNLGANDWGEIGKEGDGRLAKGTFAREYHALLDEYRKLSTNPKIVIWTALAPLGKAHGARGKPCVETLNAELVRFAGEEGLPGIDMRTPLADDIESLVLKDGIHPDPEGSRRIAKVTLNALLERVLSNRM